jgi:hypothetical protein
MAAKAIASGTGAHAVAPHHKGLIAGLAMSWSLISDAVLTTLHLKGKSQ